MADSKQIIGKPAPGPVPEMMTSVTPIMHFAANSCGKALEAYAHVFADVGFEKVMDIKSDDGLRYDHVFIKIAGSAIFMDDCAPDDKSSDKVVPWSSIFLYVKDVDALAKRAVDAGWTLKMPVMSMFWGDRMGSVIDPFGHSWAIATYEFARTPEEMEQAKAADEAAAASMTQ